MARMEIRRNNRIKLKNSKAVFLSLLQGILHKLFAYMQSSEVQRNVRAEPDASSVSS